MLSHLYPIRSQCPDTHEAALAPPWSAISLLILLLPALLWATEPAEVSWTSPVVTYPQDLDRDGNRLLDTLDTEIAVKTGKSVEPAEVIVILWEEPTEADREEFENLGGEVIEIWRYVTYGIWGRLPWDRVTQLTDRFARRLCYVQLAEKDDGRADLYEATQIVQARNVVWNTYGYTGDADGSIAILDTGIDGAHDDIGDHDNDDVCNDAGDWNDACSTGWNSAYRIQGWNDIYGADTGNQIANPVDYGSHGTLVAGCAAGDGSVDATKRGVAPASHLVGVRISANSSTFSSTRAISAMNWIVANKVCAHIKVANLSSSYSPSNPNLIMNAANNVVANGIVLTCSAGNLFCSNPILYPGRADKVITVGATNDQDQVAGYSSNGPTGIAKPDVVAPGGSALAGVGPITGPDNVCDAEYPANDYQDNQGTSFSAPIVAGAVSLLIDAWEQSDSFSWGWSEFEARKIKSVLLMTTVETNPVGEDKDGLGGCPPNSPGEQDRGIHDPVEGYGRINLDAAVEALTMSLAPNTMASATFGSNATDKKVWARRIDILGPCVRAVLDVPSSGDFDLYVYSGFPDASGIPVILGKSVEAVDGTDEEVSLEVGFVSDVYYLVVKWVSGSGQFDVYFTDGTSSNFLDVTTAPVDDSGRGAGVAWGDYDNDGDDDLYLANTATGNKLFENQGDGTFVDVTATAGVGDTDRGRTGTWGDYDNDGDLDLYLVNWSEANILFQNQGNGTFSDVTAPPLDDSGFGECGVWGDYDNDGLLDLYVVNGNDNRLFQNQGNGSFTDMTATAGVSDSATGYAAAWVDFDNDGNQDLYVCNFGPNRLFRNNGSGTFSDAPDVPLGSSAASSYGLSWGDYDNDGLLDLYVVNYYDEANVLFHNDGGPGWTFSDVTTGVLGNTGDGIGASWVDYDNDGDLDLYLANAHWNFPIVSNKLFHNDGFGFFDVTGTVLDDEADSFGAAWADMDADGDLDLYQANWLDSNHLYENDTCRGNHYLEIRVGGTSGGKSLANTGGIGARLRLVASGQAQIREIGGGSGYGQNSLTAHFGLGPAMVVDTLQVRWPGGTVQEFYDLDVDQIFDVEQVVDAIPDTPPGPAVLQLHPNVPNPFNPLTRFAYTIPRLGLVSFAIYDLRGRLVRTLVTEQQPAGSHTVSWDGRDDRGRTLTSGVYLARLVTSAGTSNRKVTLTK